jgi:hypothetical protein
VVDGDGNDDDDDGNDDGNDGDDGDGDGDGDKNKNASLNLIHAAPLRNLIKDGVVFKRHKAMLCVYMSTREVGALLLPSLLFGLLVPCPLSSFSLLVYLLPS